MNAMKKWDSPEQPIHDSGCKVGRKLQDYWRWSSSNLLDNTERGALAEFLVATSLGLDGQARKAWGTFDLLLTECEWRAGH